MENKTIIKRKNGTRKISYDFSKPVLTDQSEKNSADINNIMLQYSKTGLLPVQQEKLAQYIDNTQIMPLEQAHDLIQAAKSQFMELPAQIRKLMDNDPTKLVSFIQNPENQDILIKYKILEPVSKIKSQKVDLEPEVLNDPPAAASE